MAKNFVEELKWRGMLAQIMPGTEEYLNTHMVSTYLTWTIYSYVYSLTTTSV